MPDLSAGAIFAGYRIEEVAGRGGMGVVYRATQRVLERSVALKVIAPELAQDASFRARFLGESKVAAAIDHPNVIPVFEAGDEDGVLFLVMRYVEGTDLGALIAKERGLEPHRAVRIVEQIAAALDAAHLEGLVHRDVKPVNVLIAARGEEHAYLTDFGLAKHEESVGGLTGTGMFVGTADYAPPEQVEGRPLDCRADVYALGGLLFQAVAGRVPYPLDGVYAKAYAHMKDPPPCLSEVVPDTPPKLDEVINRAMAKDPGDRYPSTGDLGRAARSALADARPTEPERTVARGPAAPPPTRTSPAPPPAPPVPPSRPSQSPPKATPPPGPPPTAASRNRRWPRDRRAVPAGALALLAVAVLAIWLLTDGARQGACGTATELRVLTSADKEEAVRTAANDYMRDSEDGGCRTINVNVTSVPTSNQVVKAFREDWSPAALSEVGPQPDVWLPQSSAEARQVKQGRQDSARLRILSEGSIATTPLVLASTSRVPGGSVRSSDLAELRRLRTVRTNPESSTAGLVSTYALYESAQAGDEARRAVERDVLIGGDDPRALLCQLRLTGRPWRQSAFLVPANVLADFNRGRPLGGQCTGPQPPLRKSETLETIDLDPGDPTVFDHPCLRPSPRNPPDDEQERREASKGFCRYLQSESGQSVLGDHGFTDFRGSPPVDLNPKELLDRWERARRPARLLLAIDVSGSMKEPLPPTGSQRRIDAAEGAARGALGLVDSPNDSLGLWTFATRRRPVTELDALGPATRSHRDQIGRALKAIPQPAGGTPLYDTIAAGVQRLRIGWRKEAINGLVILTDGEDRNSELTAKALEDRLDRGDEKEPVRVFVVASLGGRCASLRAITPAFRGGCFGATTQGELEDTFRAVFASFGRGSPPPEREGG